MKSIHRSFRAPRQLREALDHQAVLLYDTPQAQWLSDWLLASGGRSASYESWTQLANPLLDQPLETVYIRLYPLALRVLIKTRCQLCRAFDYHEDFQLRHAFVYLYAAGHPSWDEYFGKGQHS